MSQNIYDIDTIGLGNELGNFFDFYVNNTFYLLAPEYYFPLYANYFNRCLALYDGWVKGWHNVKSGLVPQRMLQSITNGLNNMLFAHGIDFSGTKADYDFAIKWAKRTKFYKALKKAHKFAIAGGTSLLKINREDKSLYVSAHRIDTFFADIDASGKITSVKVFFDAIHNTNSSGTKDHFGICEERYFNEEGKPCVKASVYKSTSNIQTETQNRLKANSTKMNWVNLPPSVKQYIKSHYPSVIVDEEQYLPFPNSPKPCYNPS